MQRAFSLIEVIVSAGLIFLLAVLLVATTLYGEEGAQIAGTRMRATLLAEEGISTARNIRDQAFTSLSTGTFGVATSSNAWALSGTSDTKGIFTRTVAVATVDTTTKRVTSTVTWPESAARTGSVALVTYLTNTQLLVPASTQASYLVIETTGAHMTGGSFNQLQGVTIRNASTTAAITVAKVKLTWTTTANKLNAIQINGNTVWTGTATSGTLVDITDVPLTQGAGATNINYFQWNGTMTSNTYTITFTMLDNSTKAVTIGPVT